MLCQRCKRREATGYMERTINGVKTRIYVCPECFREAQAEMFSSLDNFGLFSGLAGQNDRARCPKCGTTLREISETCFVGCPYCYTELSEQIKPIIRNIQSAAMHIGTGPDAGANADEISRLKAEIGRAVESENYELAIKLRQRLREAEGERK